MKKTLSIVLLVLLVFLAVACNNTPEVHTVHTWDEGKQTLAPTCTVAGTWTKTCTVCGITKDSAIEATGHVHANLAKGIISDKDHECVAVTCVTDGEYYYRCDVCDNVFKRTVTPKEAVAAKMNNIHHVISAGNKYVTYLNDEKTDFSDDFKALNLKASEKADYNDAQIKAATEFAPKYQIALCKSCGEPLDEVAQAILNKAVSTKDSDYQSVLGSWTYKKTTVNSGDYKMYNLVIRQNGESLEAEGYSVTSTDGVVETTELAVANVKLNTDEESKIRKLTFTVGGVSSYVTAGTGGYKLYWQNVDTVLVDNDETTKTVFEHDPEHTSHSWSVMDWKGVKTFSDDGTGADSNCGKHYLECNCGVSYLKEKCTSKKRTERADLATKTDVCLYCGYQEDSTKYYNVKITDGTDLSFYCLVEKGSTLDLTGRTLSLFNRKDIKIKGWTSAVNATLDEKGFAFSADEVVLTFKEDK